jgi:hypothetical protein
MSPRNRVSLLLSAALVILGAVAIVRTATAGGSGAGRGWLALKMERRD